MLSSADRSVGKSPHSNVPCSIWHKLTRQHRCRVAQMSETFVYGNVQISRARKDVGNPNTLFELATRKMPRACPVESHGGR